MGNAFCSVVTEKVLTLARLPKYLRDERDQDAERTCEVFEINQAFSWICACFPTLKRSKTDWLPQRKNSVIQNFN